MSSPTWLWSNESSTNSDDDEESKFQIHHSDNFDSTPRLALQLNSNSECYLSKSNDVELMMLSANNNPTESLHSIPESSRTSNSTMNHQCYQHGSVNDIINSQCEDNNNYVNILRNYMKIITNIFPYYFYRQKKFQTINQPGRIHPHHHQKTN